MVFYGSCWHGIRNNAAKKRTPPADAVDFARHRTSFATPSGSVERLRSC